MSLSAKKRVLINAFALRDLYAGIRTYTESLVNGIIRKQDLDLDLIFYVPRDKVGYWGVHYDYVIASKLNKIIPPISMKPDLVHFTDQFFKYINPKQYKKSVNLVTIHDLNFLHEKSQVINKRTIEGKKILSNLSYVNRIVAISEFVKSDIINYFNIDESKISVIYNGVVPPEKPDEDFIPKYKPKTNFLFSMGYLSDKKNWQAILPLLRNYEGEYILAGVLSNQDYMKKLIDLSKYWGVSDKIKIIGAIDEKNKNWYYHHSEAFMFPSLAEGFGIPVIEAMYCGKPVFISNRTALPEITGGNSFIFETFDPDHMTDVFEKGLNEFRLNAGGIERRNKQWASQFNWDKTAIQYLEIYHELLDSHISLNG